MAITIGDISSAGSSGTTLNFPHTIGATDEVIVLVYGAKGNNPSDTQIAPTIGGVAMTEAVSALGTGFHVRASIWYLLKTDFPGTGSYTVSVSATSAQYMHGATISLIGAEEQAPESTATQYISVSNTNFDTDISGTSDGALVVDMAATDSWSPLTPGAGQTEWFDLDWGLGTTGASYEYSAGGTVNMAWTKSNSNRTAHAIASFAEAGAGLAGKIPLPGFFF